MSYMGVDVGTTGCKAVLYDERGRDLASSYREYPVLSPRQGWAELDSARVCRSCLEVIAESAAGCRTDPVRALAISSQGEAFTPVDAEGNFLANAMVSFDTRAAALAAEWSDRFGREKLYRITGHTPHPMFSLFKLLWLRRERPEVWSKATAFHCFEDLLQLRMGLRPAISWPMAARTMMFDVLKHDWDEEILAACGMSREMLARPAPSGSPVGEIPHATSQELGLPDGVVVAAGGHDQPCGALGVGIVSPGRAIYATGTVECICPAFAEARFSKELFDSNLCTYDYTVRGMYTTVAFSLTGGNILKWFRDEFGRAEVEEAQGRGVNAYEVLLAEMPDRPSGLLVLPHFTPTGTPHFDADATGAILGLRLTTRRGEILRALLEGVAFEMRLNMDILARSGMEVRELIATGGGSRSRAWTQLKADVIGTLISTAATAETGCLGAAMIARAAATGSPLSEISTEMAEPGDVFEPDRERSAYYSAQFEAYRRLYPALKPLRGSGPA